MKTADLQADKLQIIEELLKINDDRAIKKIGSLVRSFTHIKEEQYSPAALTLDELKEVLADQRANPMYISNEEATKRLAQWR